MTATNGNGSTDEGPLYCCRPGCGLMASAGGASADPWKDESGHGRHGGKVWKHAGRAHGHTYGHRRERFGEVYGRSRGYDDYEGRGGYRGARYRDGY